MFWFVCLIELGVLHQKTFVMHTPSLKILSKSKSKYAFFLLRKLNQFKIIKNKYHSASIDMHLSRQTFFAVTCNTPQWTRWIHNNSGGSTICRGSEKANKRSSVRWKRVSFQAWGMNEKQSFINIEYFKFHYQNIPTFNINQ